MTGFRVEASRTLTDAAFLSLEERHVVSSDGDAFDRVVVRHPGAVAVVPIDDDGFAVLIRQYRAAVDAVMLEIPAGKRDEPHESPEETAARELIEEIALAPGRITSLATFYNSPGFCDELTHLFLADELRAVDRPDGLRHEEAAMTVERVPLDEARGLIASGEIVDAKTIVGLLLAGRRLTGDD